MPWKTPTAVGIAGLAAPPASPDRPNTTSSADRGCVGASFPRAVRNWPRQLEDAPALGMQGWQVVGAPIGQVLLLYAGGWHD
jgi:hypothetical protein